MTWTDFLRSFFRQCAYALALFAGLALLGEFLTPGAVTPFIDPLPLALLALALLCVDAARRGVDAHRWSRLAAASGVGVLVGLLFMSDMSFSGKAEQVVLVVFLLAVCVVGGGLVFAGPHDSSS